MTPSNPPHAPSPDTSSTPMDNMHPPAARSIRTPVPPSLARIRTTSHDSGSNRSCHLALGQSQMPLPAHPQMAPATAGRLTQNPSAIPTMSPTTKSGMSVPSKRKQYEQYETEPLDKNILQKKQKIDATAPEQLTKETINESVKAAIFQARESLRHAIQRDLANTTLPRDAYEHIIQVTEKTWFHKQHQFWSKTFSSMHVLQPYNAAPESLTNLLERDVHEQAFLIAQWVDKEAVYSSISDQGLANDVSSQRLAQKQEKVVEKHSALLMRWSHGWKSKQPYHSYLVDTLNNGYNLPPAFPGTSPMLVQANAPHSGYSAYGGGYGYIGHNLSTASRPIPAQSYGLVNGSPMSPIHSTMQGTAIGNFGNQDFTFQPQSLPNVPHIATRETHATYSSGHVVTPADSTSNDSESTITGKTTKAKKEEDVPVETGGKYDIFKDLPSSTKANLVNDTTPLETVLEKYPNHLTLHRVALCFKNAGWSIAAMAKKLKEHPLKAAFIATKVGKGQLEGEAKLAALHQWVKNQRGKATQNVLNTERSAKRRRGEDLDIKPRKRRATTVASSPPAEEEENVSTPQSLRSAQTNTPSFHLTGLGNAAHPGWVAPTNMQPTVHTHEDYLGYHAEAGTQFSAPSDEITSPHHTAISAEPYAYSDVPVTVTNQVFGENSNESNTNNGSILNSDTAIPQNNASSSEDNQIITQGTNFDLTAAEIAAIMGHQAISENAAHETGVTNDEESLMRPEEVSALQEFLNKSSTTVTTTTDTINVQGQELSSMAESTMIPFTNAKLEAGQDSAQALIDKANQLWEEICNNFMNDQ